MGYKDAISGNNSGGQIVISANETYSLTASAMGTLKNGGITIDVTTIQITSSSKLYGNTNGTLKILNFFNYIMNIFEIRISLL